METPTADGLGPARLVSGGVALLLAIPIIGGLFGHASRESDSTEVFIFATPHVIRSDEAAAKRAAASREKAKGIRP